MTADLQARRRLGLTATLVREDGREGDVFSLIGPKRFDAPWKDIEAQGYIAPADCIEVRVTLTEAERMAYAVAEPEEGTGWPPSAESKTEVVAELVAKHRGEPTLVIGQYVDQLDDLAARLDAPLIKGDTTVTAARAALRGVPHRGDRRCWWSARWPTSPSTCRPPRSRSRFGRVRLPAGGGAAAGPHPAAQGDGGGARFYAVVARDTVRRRLRRAPAAIPGRAGLRLPDHGRRGRPVGRLKPGVVHPRPSQYGIRYDRSSRAVGRAGACSTSAIRSTSQRSYIHWNGPALDGRASRDDAFGAADNQQTIPDVWRWT